MDAAAVEGNGIAADVLADALAMQVDEVDEDIGLALRAGVLQARPPRRFGSPTTWYGRPCTPRSPLQASRPPSPDRGAARTPG